MSLIERIDAARERWNVLEHPFYKRWSCGELSRDELAHYAGEYRHAVVALADTAAKAGNDEHAREEAEHVDLWDEFAAAFGADTTREPSPETAECVDRLDRSGQPPRGARRPLRDRGRSARRLARRSSTASPSTTASPTDEPGAAYFALHTELDHEHAAESARASTDGPDDADRLVEVAEAALRGNWTLLDGVEARR